MNAALSSLAVAALALSLTAACSRDERSPLETAAHTSGGEDAASGGQERASEDAAAGRARAALAAELEAYEAAEPVFERHCARCHDSEGASANAAALRHFSMDDYPFGGHHAQQLGDIIPRVVGAGEHDATMPKDDPGALGDDELARIVEWAEAYERARAAGAGHHAERDHRGERDGGHRHDHDHDHDHDHNH